MNNRNDNITFKGNKIKVEGIALQEGMTLPDFQLTGPDMSDLTSATLKGKVLIISVVPSLDTPVCSNQTARFNKEASNLSQDVVILTVSRDTPFAQNRWCGVNSADRVKTASDFKYRSFGKTFGTEIPDLGLLARAVFVVDKDGKIQHAEYVPEIASEPDYNAALEKARSLV